MIYLFFNKEWKNNSIEIFFYTLNRALLHKKYSESKLDFFESNMDAEYNYQLDIIKEFAEQKIRFGKTRRR